jgi:hypothetical protein
MNAQKCLLVGMLISLVGCSVTTSRGADPPKAVRVGENDQKAFVEGIEEAEQFRRSLLTTDSKDVRRATLLCRAISRFPALTEKALKDRPTLSDFKLTETQLLQQVEGTSPTKGSDAFGTFQGRWYGVWDKWNVDHDWAEVTNYKQPKRLSDTNELGLRAVQYAWIGDGFGWNVVAVPAGNMTGDVILGSVYHLADADPKRVRSRQPHVGIAAGDGRLIWLTKQEVFFEQALPGKTAKDDRYSITGFRYRIDGGKLSADKNAFQAVYTRDEKTRPAWFPFEIDLSVK